MDVLKVYIEKPRFYYSPPEDEYAAIPRLWVNYRLKNTGTFTAVAVDVSGLLSLRIDGNLVEYKCGSHRIETIEEKQTYPKSEDETDSLLFVMDVSGETLKALASNNPKDYSEIKMRILYRNILGGHFMINAKYIISTIDEEQESMLVNWLSEMASFNIKNKKELEMLPKIKDSDKARWDETFEKLKEEFKGGLLGKEGKEENELHLYSLSRYFEINTISREEYNEASEEYRLTMADLVAKRRKGN